MSNTSSPQTATTAETSVKIQDLRRILEDRIDEQEKVEAILAELRPFVEQENAPTASPHQPSVPLDSDVHVKALEHTIQFMQDSNERVKAEHRYLWNKPNWAFQAVTALFGFVLLFGGIKLFSDWSDSAEKAKLDEMIAKTEERGRVLEKNVHDVMDEFDDKAAALDDKMKLIAAECKASMLHSEMSRQQAIGTISTAHRVLSLVALGRDQLVYHQNPRRAKFYAQKALMELDADTMRIKEVPELVSVLKKLEPSTWTLVAECEFQLQRMDDLEQVAQKITSSDCQCLEGHHYYGLAKLALAADQVNQQSRKLNVEAAVASFNRNAEAGEQGHLSLLYLSSAQVLAGRYSTASEIASDFLRALPEAKEDRVRLSDEIRAQITIATAWRNVANFLNGDRKALTDKDSSCTVDHSALQRSDAILFERVFERVISDRSHLIQDEDLASELAMYCSSMIGQLRRAHLTQSHACAAEGSTAPDDLISKYQIAPPLNVSLSQDKSLGKLVDGQLVMHHVQVAWITQARTRLVTLSDNTQREETYEFRYPVRRTIEEKFEKNTPIPERRYIPYTDSFEDVPIGSGTPSSNQAAPAPPAPVAAPAPPAA